MEWRKITNDYWFSLLMIVVGIIMILFYGHLEGFYLSLVGFMLSIHVWLERPPNYYDVVIRLDDSKCSCHQ